jgi:hypothetical protein
VPRFGGGGLFVDDIAPLLGLRLGLLNHLLPFGASIDHLLRRFATALWDIRHHRLGCSGIGD